MDGIVCTYDSTLTVKEASIDTIMMDHVRYMIDTTTIGLFATPDITESSVVYITNKNEGISCFGGHSDCTMCTDA